MLANPPVSLQRTDVPEVLVVKGEIKYIRVLHQMCIRDRLLALLTITAIPSVAMVVEVRLSSSLSLSSLEAMPMSQVPVIASFIPLVESVC